MTLTDKEIKAMQSLRTRHYFLFVVGVTVCVLAQAHLLDLTFGPSDWTDLLYRLNGAAWGIIIVAAYLWYRATVTLWNSEPEYDYSLIASAINDESPTPEQMEEAMRFVRSDREQAARFHSFTSNPIILIISVVLLITTLANLAWAALAEDTPMVYDFVSAPLMLGSVMLFTPVAFITIAFLIRTVSRRKYIDGEQLTDRGKLMLQTELNRVMHEESGTI